MTCDKLFLRQQSDCQQFKVESPPMQIVMFRVYACAGVDGFSKRTVTMLLYLQRCIFLIKSRSCVPFRNFVKVAKRLSCFRKQPISNVEQDR